MFDENFIRAALIGGPIILFSLTVHEFFHAWSALRFGDTTARDMGRLTLDPLKHLSLTGTLVMVLSGFTFGWAKPVPVNLMNVRDVRKADFWISFAGPLSNIGLAVIAGLAFQVLQPVFGSTLFQFLHFAVVINVALALFNMIPLFPLDGSHILRSVLPPRYDETLARFEQYAPFVLIILVITGGVWMIIGAPVHYLTALLMS
ncbi:site-2 protease family protein [bacterium]|nr:site-2 protease family protein [bacterium]MCB2201709.1 site-2 protease family protein [bacterium]